ncbi:MAG: alpha/beta hydrolase [Actinomycetia bacterium]|nr:alpha/beta hydrolase [Actinomycetes bacterium]
MTIHADYFAPEGLRTRGTVIVVPGRGETPATYARFGSRLAYDAYRVRIIGPPPPGAANVTAFLGGLAQKLSDAVEGVANGTPHGLARPLVLVGSDLGAAGIAALLARPDPDSAWWPQAAVLAGLPGHGARADGDWDAELDARSHCPVHRGVLSADTSLQRGALTEAVPEELLDAAYAEVADIPHLLLVGDTDPLADRPALERTAKALPKGRLTVVRGTHHDVLNDLQHRSVAAEVVTFFETLRNELAPVLVVGTSVW